MPKEVKAGRRRNICLSASATANNPPIPASGALRLLEAAMSYFFEG